jgi:flagellar motility protein MotE (MotC chaperone)
MRKMIGLLLSLSLVATAASSQTTTLYKHVDKDGKVTYSDKPPPKDDAPRKDGKASKKLDMDNERNVIKSPPKVTVNPDQARSTGKRQADIDQKERNLADAREAYENARKELEDGKEPLESEWQTIGAGKGKAARIPSEAYHERIRRLEEAVTQATTRLRDAERAMRD